MREADATKIGETVWMTARAMEFRMELHREKGGWQDKSFETLYGYLLDNLHDFYLALIRGDEREILNEGVDVINDVMMIIDNMAREELEAIQDWVPVLEQIRIKEEEQQLLQAHPDGTFSRIDNDSGYELYEQRSKHG